MRFALHYVRDCFVMSYLCVIFPTKIKIKAHSLVSIILGFPDAIRDILITYNEKKKTTIIKVKSLNNLPIETYYLIR